MGTMAGTKPLSITAAAEATSIPWETRDIVSINDSLLRVVRVEGTMDWRRHEEDQLFICWQGMFTIEVEGAVPVVMNPGDVYVIRRRAMHKTSTDGLAYALMSIGVHSMAPA
jgi:mannose-6-phosphate isomerase-like protein (cupin superfamily)